MSGGVNFSNDTGLPIRGDAVKEIVDVVLRREDAGGSLTVAVVDESTVEELNRSYRGVAEPTDVLSFAYSEDEGVEDWLEPEDQEEGYYLGDVLLCASIAIENADEDGIPAGIELGRLIVHGLLHLLGYDHEVDEGEMAARQAELSAELEPVFLRLLSLD